IPGTTIDLAVTGGPANARDWVGLALVGSANTSFVAWNYLNGSHSPPSTGVTSATLSFTAPAINGTYEIRLFENDTYTRLATSGTVQVSPDLTAAPRAVPGSTITVTL